jgi:hypothetical protein
MATQNNDIVEKRLLKIELWQEQYEIKMKRFERRLQEMEQSYETQIK